MNSIKSFINIFPIRYDDKEETGLTRTDNGSHSIQHSKSSVLIIGPVNSCKTSFLIQASKSIANYSKKPVLLIACKPLTKIPLHVHRMPQLNEITAKYITFIYIESINELINFIASLFTREASLGGLIIDDLNLFLNEESFKRDATRFFALLIEISKHIEVPLYAAFDCSQKEEIASISYHFFDEVWNIDRDFFLNKINSFVLTCQFKPEIYYYVEKNQIFLEKICINDT